VAYVVPRGDPPPSEVELQDHCAARIARYKVPRRVTFVSALPRNAAGKLVRAELRGRG
jgi:acyl-CoA synthetase (AMP-forming)/AMP-acid ligase II